MLTPIPGSQVTRQVQEQLTAFIAAENLKTGDRLPSLREFTEALGVSRPSVREGLRALEALGLVEIRHGSGSPAARRRSSTRPASSSRCASRSSRRWRRSRR